MDIRDVNFRIRLGVDYDLSNAGVLNLIFTLPPTGATFTKAATLGTAAYSGDGQSFLANQWAYYDTVAGDFTQTGSWNIVLEYADATSTYYSYPPVILEVT